MKKTKKAISLILVFSAIILSLFFNSCAHTHSFGEYITKEPTCFVDGGTYRTCIRCGAVEYTNFVKSEGHKFIHWENNIRFLNSTSACEICGLTEDSLTYTPPQDIPQIFFYGEPQGKEVYIEFKYNHGETFYEYEGSTKLDSNIDNTFHKKDYDFTIFDSEKFPNTVLLDERIGAYPSYTLKAEYSDRSFIRNLSLSNVWSEITKTRKQLNPNLKKLSSFGAEKGYPVLFYTNDNFKGLYTLCTPNDEKLFKMKSNTDHGLIYSFTSFNTFDFKYRNGNNNEVPCTVIWPRENKDKTIESFKDFINFVNTSDDSTFKERINNHLDVNAAIDYLIGVYAFGTDYNALNFCNWATFDGKQWIPSMYNLSFSLGTNSFCEYVAPGNTFAPIITEERLLSGTNSYLFDRLISLYYEQISERYIELRQTSLSDQNISYNLSHYFSMISEEVMISENEEYPEKKYVKTRDSIEEMMQWYSEKAKILDKIFIK